MPIEAVQSIRERRNALRAALREKFPRNHGQLLPALHYVQHEFRHLPDWAMEVVGWHLGIPASEVYGAATSYMELRIAEPGQRVLQVCTGISCVVNGGAQLLEDAKASLGMDAGQTASDERWTLEETPCAFLCGVAPVVRLDDHWHGRATSELVERLIDRGSEAS